jgi:cytochrome P450
LSTDEAVTHAGSKLPNFMAPDVRADPYPFYARLRREAPVARVAPLGFWLVTRYEDVIDVLRRTDDFSSTGNARVLTLPEDVGLSGLPPTIISSDNPTHDRLRSILKREFTPRAVAGLDARVRELAKKLVTPLREHDEFDLVREFSVPLPVLVIAEMLGIEPARQDEFKTWSDSLVALAGAQPDDDLAPHFAGVLQLAQYLIDASSQRATAPAADLISTLVRARMADANAIGDGEIITYCALLLVAGNETTTNLIGNLVRALLENPDQLAKLQANPGLINNAVEEALRHSSPVQGLFRLATRDVEVAGVSIPAGSTVMPMYASANRDETRFEDPDRFDIERNASHHIAFGRGLHFCLGANLARREARAALELLLPLLDRVELRSAPVEPVPSFFLRGPKALKLARVR